MPSLRKVKVDRGFNFTKIYLSKYLIFDNWYILDTLNNSFHHS